MNYVFPGLKDESCFKDDHCQFPLKCIANTCNCSALEYHVPTRINHIYPASRCINISCKFPSYSRYGIITCDLIIASIRDRDISVKFNPFTRTFLQTSFLSEFIYDILMYKLHLVKQE